MLAFAVFTSVHVTVVHSPFRAMLVLSVLGAFFLTVGAVITFILLRYGRK